MATRTARAVVKAFASLVAIGAVGTIAPAALAHEPPAAGPGTVFSTIDEAAADALRFAHARSRRNWGGYIHPLNGGFSYAPLVRGTKTRVRIHLPPDAVAWFYTRGRQNSLTGTVRNLRLSSRDRQSVNRSDPLHRPLYVLSSNGTVVVYRDGSLAAAVVREVDIVDL